MLAKKPRDTALITGASGGIGEELTKLCAAHLFDVVLVVRSEEKLHSLATALSSKHGIRAVVLAANLADPIAPIASTSN